MKILVIFSCMSKWGDDFCIQELKSFLQDYDLDLLEVFNHEQMPSNITERHQIKKKHFKYFPYAIIEISNIDILKEIIKKTVLISAFIHLLGLGSTYEELIKNIDKESFYTYQNKECGIAYEFKAYQSSISKEEKMQLLQDYFADLKIKGKFNLSNPDQIFWICENHVKLNNETPFIKNKYLQNVFFGVEIARVKKGQSISLKYELKERVYLGPTSTDEDLAFLMFQFLSVTSNMILLSISYEISFDIYDIKINIPKQFLILNLQCNQANVKKGDIVLDPFLGTAGLLIPPAHHGAICYGSEIDARVLHGCGVGRLNEKCKYYKEIIKPNINNEKINIYSNFKQYNLEPPQFIRMDVVQDALRECQIFDAIICDPPYGFRAAAKKTGSKKEIVKPKPDQIFEMTYAPTKHAEINELVDELFSLCDRMLKIEGKLVMLYPFTKDNYEQIIDDSLLPKRKNYILLDYSENILSHEKSRLLLTYKRIISQ